MIPTRIEGVSSGGVNPAAGVTCENAGLIKTTLKSTVSNRALSPVNRIEIERCKENLLQAVIRRCSVISGSDKLEAIPLPNTDPGRLVFAGQRRLVVDGFINFTNS